MQKSRFILAPKRITIKTDLLLLKKIAIMNLDNLNIDSNNFKIDLRVK